MLKRLFDLGVAALALTLLWPLMLAVALIVKLDTPGPVFFRQQRIGRHGVPFRIHKFRTMVQMRLSAGLRSPLATICASRVRAAGCAGPSSTSCRNCWMCWRAT